MSGATLSHYAQYYGIRGSAAALRRLSFERAGAIELSKGKVRAAGRKSAKRQISKAANRTRPARRTS